MSPIIVSNSSRFISEVELLSPYPDNTADRDRWIIAQRPARVALNMHEPYGFFVEQECSPVGEIIPVATILLTNRECPLRCVMCDLWRHTLEEPVSRGAIPRQIDFALEKLPHARTVKLYNSGSFFDPHAIPPDDYREIAARIRTFERVVVECHPLLVGARCLEFKSLLSGRLEVAMGLETANPTILEKLNKRMTLKQFAVAADFLESNDIDLRVFILVQPPFMKTGESLYWAQKSIDFAFACKALAVTLIPTRGGNGAMEELAASGDFVAPDLDVLEKAVSYGVSLKRGLVFADLWDLKPNSHCVSCLDARLARLKEMNLRQEIIEPVTCDQCKELV